MVEALIATDMKSPQSHSKDFALQKDRQTVMNPPVLRGAAEKTSKYYLGTRVH